MPGARPQLHSQVCNTALFSRTLSFFNLALSLSLSLSLSRPFSVSLSLSCSWLCGFMEHVRVEPNPASPQALQTHKSYMTSPTSSASARPPPPPPFPPR